MGVYAAMYGLEYWTDMLFWNKKYKNNPTNKIVENISREENIWIYI